MSQGWATPGSTFDAARFQVAANGDAVHSAVTGRTANPRQETAQAASVIHPGQCGDLPVL